MKVTIDGVEYVPLVELPKDKSLLSALEVRFSSDAGDDITVREYLRILLATLWEEKEEFSGKRPFGNSCWEHDLFAPLIKEGFITGTFDEDGHIDSYNRREAHNCVFALIRAAFYGVENE